MRFVYVNEVQCCIRYDWRMDRAVFQPPAWRGLDINEPEFVWDGRGVAMVDMEVFALRLSGRRPEICDVVEIRGASYVVVGYGEAWQGDCVAVMRESDAAHALARFNLCFEADFTVQIMGTVVAERLHRLRWGRGDGYLAQMPLSTG